MIELTWHEELKDEYSKAYYKKLYDFVQDEYKNNIIYPPQDKILNALHLTPLDSVKCVIIGQDPYHGPNQAMGLSFSVNKNIPIPKSLQNIYKELQNELSCYIPNHGDLTSWAEQGVLLLNSILTVRAGQAASHKNMGWEEYTDAILKILNNQDRPIVFLLWGNFAKSKSNLITNSKHLILKSAHPSPLSANYGFFGCGHFKTCNEFLTRNNIKPIDWQIKNI